MILAGDIGGTKTHLVIFEAADEEHPSLEKKYPSGDYPTLSEILRDFLSQYKGNIEKMCLGIAGPIQDNRCQTTNLPWVIDAREISKEFKIPSVGLINDLEANAYGLSALSEEEFFVLNEGKKMDKTNAAMISAGTGLGEAGLYWNGEEHLPFACEGGHCDFAPKNELEIGLLRYLQAKYKTVSYERIVSGMGFRNIYSYLVDSGIQKKEEAVEEIIEKEDPAFLITELGLKKQSPICEKVLEIFCAIYGSESGNLALKMLSQNGLYIGGGIAPKILDVLKKGGFFEAFINKGRYRELLSRIPIKVVLNENTALLGAALYARIRL